MKYDYLIVGGGIAGVMAAETIRANDQNGTILLIGDEPHIIYSRVLLPYYIKGKLERNKIFLRQKSDFEAKKIDLVLGKRIAAVDAKNKTIIVDGGREVGYGKIVFTTGGRARRIDIKGCDKKNIFYLQTIDDADKIKSSLQNVKKAVVIGGGFMAFEFLDIFYKAGIDTTLICRSDRFFGEVLDEAGNEIMNNNFLLHGIKTIFKEEVKEIEGADGAEGIVTKSGQKFDCDAIGVGIGLERNISFLSGSGIKTKEGILANERLESEKDIWAAGDVAQYFDSILGRERVVGNWNNAFLSGKRAGENVVGQNKEFRIVSSYSVNNLGFNLIFLGETKDFDDSIVKIKKDKNRYERIFIKNGIIVGAALINAFEEKEKIKKMIENRFRTEDL